MSLKNLFTEKQLKQFKENGGGNTFSFKNHIPVAYLRIRKLGLDFLITELHPVQNSYAFGLQSGEDMLPNIDLIDLNELEKKAADAGDFLENKSNVELNQNLAVYARASVDMIVLEAASQTTAFKEKMDEYSSGKNVDKEQDLRNLKFKLTW